MERKSEVLLYKWVKPHHHVVGVVSCAILAMILGYVISVTSEHVNILFPYISDTGTKPPASCVFGLFLNLASIFGFTTMLIRHRYFEKYNGIDTYTVHAVNDVSLFIGSLSAFGIMLVANFQETNQLSVHLIGAIMAFGLGILYCLMHSYLTYATLPSGLSTKLKLCVRIFLVGIAILAFICTTTGATIAQNEYRKMNVTDHDEKIKLQWKSNELGYSGHLVSTFSEWIMVICFLIFLLTYYYEFKCIHSYLSFECVVFDCDQPLIQSTASGMLTADSRESISSAVCT